MSVSTKESFGKKESPLAFAVKNFSPAWFSMTMGVGISASILFSFPYHHEGLRIAGMAIWGVDIILFILCTFMFLLRFFIYPEQFGRMMKHAGQSMFLGCIPMGLTTIINMISLVSAQYNLKGGWQAAYALWWVDNVLSVLSCCGVVLVMFDIQKRTQPAINATILLPIVPLVVAAASGGLISKNLPQHLLPSTLVVSFLMWSVGVGLACICMAIYVFRLLVENVQPNPIVLSTLLTVGPMGQGAFGIMLIGDLYRRVFAMDLINPAISAVYENSGSAVVFSTAIAFILMSVGVFWLVMTVFFVIRNPPPGYNQSFWALTFPIGTMTLGWYQLAIEYDCEAFRVIGAIFGCFVVSASLTCFLASIKYAILSDVLFRQAKAETDPEA